MVKRGRASRERHVVGMRWGDVSEWGTRCCESGAVSAESGDGGEGPERDTLQRQFGQLVEGFEDGAGEVGTCSPGRGEPRSPLSEE